MIQNNISFRRRLLLAAIASAVALSGCSDNGNNSNNDDDSGVDISTNLHVASPEWQDQIIYFVMTDRFNDGDPSNNDQGSGEYNPENKDFYSGGDLKGITDKVNYIQNLGATAVWITPPVANLWFDQSIPFTGYHGYWAENFKEVDAHYGTLDDYKNLSSALHNKGMYLIQDIVVNHTGNFFGYEGGIAGWSTDDPAQNFMLNDQATPQVRPSQAPFDLNDATNPEHVSAAIYHWTPDVEDFQDENQEKNYQLQSLDDLNTSNPVVREAMRDSYAYWIEEVGVDAFRVDTAKFVEHEFWHDFFHSTDAENPGILAAAAATGRDNFLAFGEVFESSLPFETTGDEKVVSYLGSDDVPEFPSLIQFPLREDIDRVFAGGLPTSLLAFRLETFMDETLYKNPYITPTFIDNHDMARVRSKTLSAGMKQALAFIMTIPGIPIIYQGTEQEFTESRSSMFAGGWQSEDADHVNTDHFNENSDIFLHIRQLADLRKSNKIFTRGTLEILAENGSGPGVLAYQREYEGKTAIIVFNTADGERLLNLDTDLAAGTRLDLMFGMGVNGGFVLGEEGKLAAELPAKSIAVLMQSDEISEAPAAVSVTIDQTVDGETLTEDLALSGTLTQGVERMLLVVDGIIDTATEASIADNGSWSANLSLDNVQCGVSAHTVDYYFPDQGAVALSQSFTSDVPFNGVRIVSDDPTRDDTGPTGLYTYPEGDGSYGDGGQADIEEMKVEACKSTLFVTFTMNTLSQVWVPPNEFDHTSFNIYLDVPGEEGLSVLPKIQANAPDGFLWDISHQVFGWSNELFGTTDASEDSSGNPRGVAPTIVVDAENNLIQLSYDGRFLGISDWTGTKVYATTWDIDGLENIHRGLKTPPDLWTFGGGSADDPLIMDDTEVVTVPAIGGNFDAVLTPLEPEEDSNDASLGPYGTELYVRGINEDWETTNQMSHADNIFSSTIALNAGDHNFKLADAEWSAGSNFGSDAGFGESVEISLGTAVALTDGGGNLQLAGIAAGDYTFTLDATDSAAPVLTVTGGVDSANPYGVDLFLRGANNEWDPNNRLSFADNQFSIVVELNAGDHTFKIADANWTAGSNFGSDASFGESVEILLNTGLALTDGGGNLKLTGIAAGTYTFTLDVSSSTTSPTLTVTQ